MFPAIRVYHHAHLYHHAKKNLSRSLSLGLHLGRVNLPQDGTYRAWTFLSSLVLPVHRALSLMQNEFTETIVKQKPYSLYL